MSERKSFERWCIMDANNEPVSIAVDAKTAWQKLMDMLGMCNPDLTEEQMLEDFIRIIGSEANYRAVKVRVEVYE